jgi:membrane-associated protease RseP (regulator of RpoE activity)
MITSSWPLEARTGVVATGSIEAGIIQATYNYWQLLEDLTMEQTPNYRRYKILLLVLTGVVFIWGAIGALDITRIPYAGYTLSPDGSRVTLVRAGSPAEQAGIKVGDTVTRMNGIPISDFAALTERGRPAIDSDGSVTVKRDATEQTLTFKYARPPLVDVMTGPGFLTLIGLAFLILGLMVYLKNPTRLSASFCSLSLLFAVTLFNAPYLASSLPRRIIGAVLSMLLAILLAVLLNYCLNFPSTKTIMIRRPWLRQASYLIAVAYGVMLATIIFTTPPMWGRRVLALSIINGLIIGGYVLLSVISVIHSYIKASAEDRKATGLNFMLLGLVIGFVPILLAVLLHTFIPHMADLPGERFYSMTMLAIPIGMALALMKREPALAAVKPEERPAT